MLSIPYPGPYLAFLGYIITFSITPTGGGGGGVTMLAPDRHDFECKLFVSVATFIPRHKVLFKFIVPCNYYGDLFFVG